MTKTLITGIVVLMLTGLYGVVAQAPVSYNQAESATALIKVNVVPGVGVRTVSDLHFGQVSINSGITRVEMADPSSAHFVISGMKNAEVSVQLTASEHLSGPGSHAIPFSPAAGYSEQGGGSAFTMLPAGGIYTIRLAGPSTDDQTGTLHLTVSGSIDVGLVPAGHYSGIVTLSAVYH